MTPDPFAPDPRPHPLDLPGSALGDDPLAGPRALTLALLWAGTLLLIGGALWLVWR